MIQIIAFIIIIFSLQIDGKRILVDPVFKAFKDLNGKRLLAVHSSKFALSVHPWDEPLIKIATKSREQNINLLTPMIGEQVNFKDSEQKFTEWWKGLK